MRTSGLDGPVKGRIWVTTEDRRRKTGKTDSKTEKVVLTDVIWSGLPTLRHDTKKNRKTIAYTMY